MRSPRCAVSGLVRSLPQQVVVAAVAGPWIVLTYLWNTRSYQSANHDRDRALFLGVGRSDPSCGASECIEPQ